MKESVKKIIGVRSDGGVQEEKGRIEIVVYKDGMVDFADHTVFEQYGDDELYSIFAIMLSNLQVFKTVQCIMSQISAEVDDDVENLFVRMKP